MFVQRHGSMSCRSRLGMIGGLHVAAQMRKGDILHIPEQRRVVVEPRLLVFHGEFFLTLNDFAAVETSVFAVFAQEVEQHLFTQSCHRRACGHSELRVLLAVAVW